MRRGRYRSRFETEWNRGKATTVARLAERIKREHGTEIDVSTFERTRAGHWQRSSGAWSWSAFTVKVGDFARHEIGSQYPVKELLKAAKLSVEPNQFQQIEIDPI